MEQDNPYIDPALKQAQKLKKIIDKLAVWEARKQNIIDSPDYAANQIMSVWNESEDYPEQIEIQKQIDELIYTLTSFKIGHEDDDDWVPEDDTEKMTMIKLKEDKWKPKPLLPKVVKPSFGTAENRAITEIMIELIKSSKQFKK